MSSVECDVVVVGLGPGGQGLATDLAKAGLDVVGVEMHLIGGECPFYGCTPSKLMIRSADLVNRVALADELAGPASIEPDWSRPAGRITDEATHGWHDDENAKAVEEAGVRIVRGHGRLAGVGRVEVDGTTYAARRGVVLNTGTAPLVLPIDGLAGTPYWTNRDVVQVTELPASLAVIGGGAIGCELAQVFARFGVKVTLLEATDRLIANGEPEASELAAETLRRDGVDVRTGVEVKEVRHDGTFTLSGPDLEVTAERLLVAAGRATNLGDIGLETVGLDPDAKTIEVDERLRAGDRLWAIGDITGKGMFTHVSSYQADIAKADILEEPDAPVADYHAVSWVAFTDPEIGSTGKTEQAAREAGIDVCTGYADLKETARGWLDGAGNDGFVKLVADRATGTLVGATVAGRTGGDLIAMLTLAVHAKVPVATMAAMHYAFPTYHGGVLTAVREVQSALDA